MNNFRRFYLLGLFVLVTEASTPACKQKDTATNSPTARPEVASNKPRVAPGNQAVFDFHGVGKRLVKSIGGFTIAAPPRYFGPENLYTLINGGADSYVSLGLREMVTADYTSGDRRTVTITVEIYDMANQKNASARFAKFLQGRQDPKSATQGLPEDMKGRGILGAASATFWMQQYLVTMTLIDDSDTATSASMTTLGAELLPIFVEMIDHAP